MSNAPIAGARAAALPHVRLRQSVMIVVWTTAFCIAAVASAQRSEDASRRAQRKKSNEPEARVERLTTKDGVQLRMGYFPSDRGKEAVPVLIVHEWEGQGSPYASLAYALQKAGCAVALPDLRGHGGSKVRIGRNGAEETIDPNRLGRAGVAAVVRFDLEAVKSFLRKENDAGQLNLNALTLVGVREGAVLAMNWAVADWSWPALPGRKQGQDVRALVLLSPVRQINGSSIDAAIRHPVVGRLPTLVVVGSQSSEAKDAERLVRLLSRNRTGRNPGGPLEVEEPKTSLSGARLLAQSDETAKEIVQFITTNLVDQQENFPWIER